MAAGALAPSIAHWYYFCWIANAEFVSSFQSFFWHIYRQVFAGWDSTC